MHPNKTPSPTTSPPALRQSARLEVDPGHGRLGGVALVQEHPGQVAVGAQQAQQGRSGRGLGGLPPEGSPRADAIPQGGRRVQQLVDPPEHGAVRLPGVRVEGGALHPSWTSRPSAVGAFCAWCMF